MGWLLRSCFRVMSGKETRTRAVARFEELSGRRPGGQTGRRAYGVRTSTVPVSLGLASAA